MWFAVAGSTVCRDEGTGEAMKVRAVAAVALVLTTVAACGDSGVSTGDFVDDVDAVCGTLDADLSDVVQPATAGEIAGFASSAAALYRDAIADLNKLSVPGGSAPAVVDAKTFVSNLNQQAALLDSIAASAGVDQPAADASIAQFEALAATNDGLAQSIGAERCVLDPLLGDVAPAPTTVPSTDPPLTTVPATAPPATTAPATNPPVTDPPVTGSNKTIITIAAELAPNGVFTFAETEATLTQTYLNILDIAPSTASMPGTVSGVEVFDGGDLPIARIFVFLPEQSLGADSLAEVTDLLSGGSTLTPATFGTLSGQTVLTDGGIYFVGSNDPTTVGLMVWAVSPSVEGLDAAIQAFLAGLSG